MATPPPPAPPPPRSHRVVFGKAPTRQLHIAVSGVVTPENKVTHLSPISKEVGTRYSSLTSGSWKDAVHLSCDSPNTSRRFALLVQAMSAWLVKTRRDPSRNRGDARVKWAYDYGHAQTEYTLITLAWGSLAH